MSSVGSSNGYDRRHNRMSGAQHELRVEALRRQYTQRNSVQSYGGDDSGHGVEREFSAIDEPDEPTPDSKLIDFSYVIGPHVEQTERGESGARVVLKGKKSDNKAQTRSAPEQRITIFALRLALLEKSASGVGTLAFLWATVVILGGFASTITFENFCVTTAIIFAEGSRIFSRSHELEWQQLSAKSNDRIPTGFVRFASNVAQSLNLKGRQNKSRSISPRQWLETLRSRSPPSRMNSSSDFGQLSYDSPTNTGSSDSKHDQSLGKPMATGGDPEAPNPTPCPPTRRQPTHIQRRTWSSSNLPLLPYLTSAFTTKVVSRILYYVQLVSAAVCVGLSLWRLVKQNFYVDSEGKLPNVTMSMNVFYVLGLLEAGLFLLERVYWEYRIAYTELLEKVRKEADLQPELAGVVEQFFYDVYARCLEGSVFDGLEMDLVAYGISWLESEDFKQQYDGARLLNGFISSNGKLRPDNFAKDALRRLGTTPGIIERLVEMLSWNSRHEEHLLTEIASIVSSLVLYNRNCSRFVAVPGSMDAVVSLLLPTSGYAAGQMYLSDLSKKLRLTGLRILKCLCKDSKNSLKIGETRNLLSILILFVEVREGKNSLKGDKFTRTPDLKVRLKTYKKSLQVLLLLAAAANTSGEVLRGRIASVVSGLKNLRDVIQYGSERPELQRLAIDILFHMAKEEKVSTSIGATGGVIRNLFELFTHYDANLRPSNSVEPKQDSRFRRESTAVEERSKTREDKMAAGERAGEVLMRLVLQNEANCLRLLQLHDRAKHKPLVTVLVHSLSKPDKISSSAANILRSVIEYGDETTRTDIIEKCGPFVLQNNFTHCSEDALVKSEKYEASLGLAARILPLVDERTYLLILQEVKKTRFLDQLRQNLRHAPTSNKYPSIRRYTVELVLALINKDDSFVDTFRKQQHVDLIRLLTKTLDSISEVENFCLFSGLLGCTRHSEEMETLVNRCIGKVMECQTRVIPSS